MAWRHVVGLARAGRPARAVAVKAIYRTLTLDCGQRPKLLQMAYIENPDFYDQKAIVTIYEFLVFIKLGCL